MPPTTVQTWLRVPGMLCTPAVFSGLDPHLDIRGESVDVPLSGRTLEEAARLLLERARRAPGPVGVIAVSLGAIVTMAAAAREPAAFAALVLVSTNARDPRPSQRREWQDLTSRVDAGEFDQLVSDLSLTLWAPSLATHERLAQARAMAHTIGADAFLDQLEIQQTRHDLRAGLTNVDSPALVLAGGCDQLCPVEYHEEIDRALPRSRLRVLDGLGHLLTVERPALVAEEITAWWRTASRASPPPDPSPTVTAS